MAQLLHKHVQMRHPSLDEVGLQVANGFLWRYGRNVVAWPSFSKGFAQNVEVRVSFANLEVASHFISLDLISDVILVFDGPFD